MLDIRRRQFLTLLGGAAVVLPLAARAQQPATPVIGLLSGVSAAPFAPLVEGFRSGLRETGYFESRNLTIEYRWADGKYDRLPALAANLVEKRVAVIFTMGENAAKAAQAASAGVIPIVFALGDDPVTLGLVNSLNRPGANITGMTSIGHSLGPKRVELIREFIPTANAIALLVNPKHPRESERQEIEDKARTFGWQLRVLGASSTEEFASVFATLVTERIGALVIGDETLFFSESRTLASLAVRHSVPAIGPLRSFADAGGLMSLGTNIPEMDRQAGIYVGRILKGEKPANMPVMQPTRFQLVINLKTAKALSLPVPPTLQVAADEVIE
jgi:putative tryptophan/tyrosine transport system substrate-binding protein